MAKYDKYVKPLAFFDDGYGSLRQKVVMDHEFLGMDVIIEFGTLWSAGMIGKEPHIPHKHNFSQIMYWFSGNTSDMSDLGAELELFLGEENEKYMVNCSTAVGIPAGMPHMPARVLKMDRRIIFMTVSVTGKYEETPLPVKKDRFQNQPLVGFNAKYRVNLSRCPSFVKAPGVTDRIIRTIPAAPWAL